jgi:hypothetical protein
MRRQTRSLEDCLMADAGLARFSSHARRLLELQHRFRSATPLARSARVANLKFGRVVIHADNGAVATKIRQMAPRLVDIFLTAGVEVTGIDIRVQPIAGNPPRPVQGPAPGIGFQQKQGLTSLANGLPDDSPLKAALLRFAKQARER